VGNGCRFKDRAAFYLPLRSKVLSSELTLSPKSAGFSRNNPTGQRVVPSGAEARSLGAMTVEDIHPSVGAFHLTGQMLDNDFSWYYDQKVVVIESQPASQRLFLFSQVAFWAATRNQYKAKTCVPLSVALDSFRLGLFLWQ
jgi:hypothetical protein